MKFSFFTNDKSTAKDEFALLGFIAVCILTGIVLIIMRPEFWIVDQTITASFGVLLMLTGVMFIPGLIYRFMINDKKSTK